jgi:hypothetical protein
MTTSTKQVKISEGDRVIFSRSGEFVQRGVVMAKARYKGTNAYLVLLDNHKKIACRRGDLLLLTCEEHVASYRRPDSYVWYSELPRRLCRHCGEVLVSRGGHYYY